jgi:hypothetical protein
LKASPAILLAGALNNSSTAFLVVWEKGRKKDGAVTKG